MLRSTVLLIIASLTLAAADHHVWHTGRVVDTQASKSSAYSGASTDSWIPGSTTTTIQRTTIRDTDVTIVGTEYMYVAEDSDATTPGTIKVLNRKHGCQYIIGEDIRYVQEKSKLLVLDANGKQCKLDIVRQERVQPK